MTLGKLVELFGFETLTGEVNLNAEVISGYTSDLLSDVIAINASIDIVMGEIDR